MKGVALLAAALLLGLVLAGCSSPIQPAGDGGGDGEDSTGTSSGSKSGTGAAGKGSTSTKSTSGTATRPAGSTGTSTSTTTGSSTSTNTSGPITPAGKVLPAQVASIREWGEPVGKGIRPGIDTSQGGSACTANFLYHLNDTRYFIGLAAHCFQTGSNPVSESCPTDNGALGMAVTLHGDDGTDYGGRLAYNSYLTMQQVGETNPDVCDGNDFALVEIDPRHVDSAHPAVLYYGGPTSALDAGMLQAGDAVHDYGNSDIRSGYETVPTPMTNPHDGTFLNYDYGGWELVTRFVPPTIQGDSGSGLLGPNGEAAGVLSSGSITYTEAQFTSVAYALNYMQKRLGWAPSVVTWSEFSAAGIEDP